VVPGWNWIGYVPQGPIEVTTALADLGAGALVTAGDVVKSQTGFAEYVGGVWYGSLGVMEPGRGYKLKLGGAASGSFQYPVYVPTAAEPVPLLADTEIQLPDGAPEWTVNASEYQFNTTLTSVLRVGGRESNDANDMIGAFVGDECRGVARPVYVDGVERYVAFLMIHTNAASGETVQFRAFDADAGVVYRVSETLACAPDDVNGTVGQPVVLNASEPWSDTPSLPTTFGLVQNYPNPFNPQTTIRFDLPQPCHVVLRIYNVRGQEVLTAEDRDFEPGYHRYVWEGRNNAGQPVASGVYFYRLEAATFTDVKKMLLLR
jgi:hypothetical protein